jgi:hypothetical protein
MVIRGNLFILSNIRDKWDHARDLDHLDHKASIKEATRDKGKHLMIHYHRQQSSNFFPSNLARVLKRNPS